MQNISKWLSENWFKVAGLLIVLVLGLAFIIFLNTKENNRHAVEVAAAEQKELQDKKEFAAERKSDCLAIYTTESGKWNNVTGWRYDEYKDQCYIQYKEGSPKTAAKCDELYSVKGEYGYLNVFDNLLCKDGQFENVF